MNEAHAMLEPNAKKAMHDVLAVAVLPFIINNVNAINALKFMPANECKFRE